MSRKAILLFASAVVLACTAPAAASANWTHSGDELAQNATLSLSGGVTFEFGEGDTISCPETTADVELTAGTPTAHLQSFSVDNLAKCHITGTIGSLCGTNKVSKVQQTGAPADLTTDGTKLLLSGFLVHYYLGTPFPCLVPMVSFESSSIKLTAANPDAIGQLSFSGVVLVIIGFQESTGTIKGTVSATPSGTYGLT